MKKFKYLLILIVLILVSPQYVFSQESSSPSANTNPLISKTNSKSSNVCTRVGSPTASSPCGSATTTASSIVEWDEKINQALERGAAWGLNLFNKLSTAITNGTYSTGTWAGANIGSVYWCTYSIVDSYNLAGFSGLIKGNQPGAHNAVVNMRAFWKGPGAAKGFKYINYEQNHEALDSVHPGDAMFMELYAGQFTDNEHVALVKEIKVNERGDGEIITLESNSSAKTHNFPVDSWIIKKVPYPVRGFGGI